MDSFQSQALWSHPQMVSNSQPSIRRCLRCQATKEYKCWISSIPESKLRDVSLVLKDRIHYFSWIKIKSTFLIFHWNPELLEGYLWWLIFCVNWAGPWCPDNMVVIILDVSVRVFSDEVNIQICELWESGMPSFMWVGPVQSVEGLIKHKADHPQARGNSTACGLFI